MNILTKDTTLTWWQLGILKIAVLAIGIVIGANWSEVFVPQTVPLLIGGVVLSLYLGFVWFKR